MSDERLADLLARLDRERQDADQQYNDALTALDAAIATPPELPDPPSAYDDAQVTAINEAWDILPDGPPAIDRSIKGRLRGAIWQLVGPALSQQKAFNAALVDHLNRNVAKHGEHRQVVTALVESARDHLQQAAEFQARLLRLLQAITLYVDTKDRAIAGQAQVINANVSTMADDWLKRSGSLATREQRLAGRLAALDDLRATATLAQQTALSLKREVERLVMPAAGLPGAVPPAVDLDAYTYLGFEDQFRGSVDEIRARLSDYVPLFADARDVIDLGCGRGEFLDLLREAAVPARGVDMNHEMVEASRGRGFEVSEGDALGFLQTLPDNSIDGVFAAQVVEHLEPTYLMRLLETAHHKMRPGGVIVLETINAACWLAFFESYIRDLTHVRPLHPETLQYLLRVSGFHDVEVRFRGPESEAEQLDPAPVPPDEAGASVVALATAFNDNVARLNARLFTHMDYAAIGRA